MPCNVGARDLHCAGNSHRLPVFPRPHQHCQRQRPSSSWSHTAGDEHGIRRCDASTHCHVWRSQDQAFHPAGIRSAQELVDQTQAISVWLEFKREFWREVKGDKSLVRQPDHGFWGKADCVMMAVILVLLYSRSSPVGSKHKHA